MVAREKQYLGYCRKTNEITVDFSLEAMETRRNSHDIFHMLNAKNHKPRILCPTKISFRNVWEIKKFSYEGKPSKFVDSRPFLKE